MSGRKQGKGGHHKGYRGPWPEDHSAIPGRQAKQGGGEKPRPEGGTHAPQVHKIPQQAPKPK
jgi:hypothetical protein